VRVDTIINAAARETTLSSLQKTLIRLLYLEQIKALADKAYSVKGSQRLDQFAAIAEATAMEMI
jgi:hypothetical protein